jgi:hypothetical protein
MASHRENFESWFVKVLESLYPCRDAGFVIVMTAFPLLERYLREKVGLSPNVSATDDVFYNALYGIFPELETKDKAKEFWQVYCHGLLHEATFSGTNRRGDSLSVGWLSHDGPIVSIDKSDGSFLVNPVALAQRVLQIIIRDFATFEGGHSSQLPVVKPYTAPWNLATTAPSRGITPLCLSSLEHLRRKNREGSFIVVSRRFARDLSDGA